MEIIDSLSNGKITIADLSKEDLLDLITCEGQDVNDLMKLANSKKEETEVTYSKNVFIPVTEICKNDCGYCNFKKTPDDPDAIILKKPEEILKTLKESERYDCKEALFTFGEDADENEAVLKRVDNLNYIDSILNSWRKKGYKNKEDVKKEKESFRKKKEKIDIFDTDWLNE